MDKAKKIKDVIHELNLKRTRIGVKSLNIEAVEMLNDFKCDSNRSAFDKGKMEGLYEARKMLEEVQHLDEPQKPVIQQFVADLVDWTVRGNCIPSDVIREFQTNTPDTVNLPKTLELEKLGEYFEKAYCRYDFEKACFVGYEVEKEPLYRVKIGEGYFVEHQGRGALIMPDCNKEIKIFDSKSDAERTAQTIGGTVEEVAEG